MYRHAAQIHRADTMANPLVVDDAGEELPRFVLGDFAFGFVASHLLVERVEQLLAGGGAGKGSAVVEGAAEAPEVEQSLGSAVEGNTHAVEQVNDTGGHVAHDFCRRLVGKEVAAIDGVVEVLPGGVAFALQVLRGIDAALRADRVRPLDRNDGEKVNVTSHLGNFDGGRKPCQSATHNDDLRICHILPYKVLSTATNTAKTVTSENANRGSNRARHRGPGQPVLSRSRLSSKVQCRRARSPARSKHSRTCDARLRLPSIPTWRQTATRHKRSATTRPQFQ